MKTCTLTVRTLALGTWLLTQLVLPADAATAIPPPIHDRIESLLHITPRDEMERQTNIYFKTLTSDEIAFVPELLANAKPSFARKVCMSELIARWGTLNGSAAYKFAQSQTIIGRVEAETAALYGWASQEPDKAWFELMVVSNRAADLRYNVVLILERIADANLDLALQYYQDLVPDRACLHCSAAYLMNCAAKDAQFDKILNCLKRMPPGPAREALNGEYWGYLGQYELDFGLALLKGISGAPEAKIAETALCKGWAYANFDDCLEYILHAAVPGRFDDLILPAVQVWSRNAKHEDVVRLVKTLPPELCERSLLGLATSLCSVDPKVTLDWVKSFPASKVRDQSLDRAMTRWAKIDSDAARDYMHQIQDREIRGILTWNYLLSKLDNQTMGLDELNEIDNRYNMEWRIRLFGEISAKLADPLINSTGKYDLSVFRVLVEKQPDLTTEAKLKILGPLKKQ